MSVRPGRPGAPPPPLILNNSATSRSFSPMQSSWGKSQGREQAGLRLGPKVKSGRKEFPNGGGGGGVPAREFPRDRFPFVL